MKKVKAPAPIQIISTPTVISTTPEKTVADKIWDQIKYVEFPMFGLPNQSISKYCSPVSIEPTKLYLTYKIGSVLPLLEEIFKGKYSVERVDKYITIAPLKDNYAQTI